VAPLPDLGDSQWFMGSIPCVISGKRRISGHADWTLAFDPSY
jgi:hypothetical protein